MSNRRLSNRRVPKREVSERDLPARGIASAPSVDPTTFVLLLGRLARLNEATVTDVCAEHATTPAELRVLSVLVHRPDGAASPSAIAHFVVQTSGGLTATLKRLEDDGLVERLADPTDGRGRLVVLTEAGRRRHEVTLAAVTERIARATGDLDLAIAGDLVRALVVGLEADRGLPSSAEFVAGIPVAEKTAALAAPTPR